MHPETHTAANWAESKAGLGYGAGAVLFWSLGALLFCHLIAIPLFQYIAISQLVGGSLCTLLSGGSLHPASLYRRLTEGWVLVLLLATNMLAYAIAFRIAPPVHADLINYLWPAMLVIGSAHRHNHTLLPKHVLGMGLGFLGIFILLLPDIIHQNIHLTYALGYISAFIAALAWTIYSIMGGDRASKGGSVHMGEDIVLVGLFCAGIQAAQGDWVTLTAHQWIVICTLGVLVYGLAFPFWKKGLELGDYAPMAAMANAIPVLSVLWLILGGVAEMTLEVAIASGLITASCWVLQSAPPKLARPDAKLRTV